MGPKIVGAALGVLFGLVLFALILHLDPKSRTSRRRFFMWALPAAVLVGQLVRLFVWLRG